MSALWLLVFHQQPEVHPVILGERPPILLHLLKCSAEYSAIFIKTFDPSSVCIGVIPLFWGQ